MAAAVSTEAQPAQLNAGTWPRDSPTEERLLVIDPHARTVRHAVIGDLPAYLRRGDALIVNDAATLPASLHTRDRTLEVRLAQGLDGESRYRAVLFGPGDFRARTEDRTEPRPLRAGDRLHFEAGLHAVVERVDPEDPRFVDLAFDARGADFYQRLYRAARPVQYAHVAGPLALYHVQTRFAARPWAFEMASAGRPLTWGTLLALRRRGVELGVVTHAAGLSSTGSARLDARFPLPERYAVPEKTHTLVARTRRLGGRVVAVGTTVVRALEASAAEHGSTLRDTEGEARLLLGPGFRPRVVDGVLTGMHEPGTSHFALMRAFAPEDVLLRALDAAAARGYLQHEFGDSSLVLAARSEDDAGGLWA